MCVKTVVRSSIGRGMYGGLANFFPLPCNFRKVVEEAFRIVRVLKSDLLDESTLYEHPLYGTCYEKEGP